MLLQEQIIQELAQIPDNKLAEIYDLIHYFRLGLAQENLVAQTITQRPIGLANQYPNTDWKQALSNIKGVWSDYEDIDDKQNNIRQEFNRYNS
jgi:hypothetical protein